MHASKTTALQNPSDSCSRIQVDVIASLKIVNFGTFARDSLLHLCLDQLTGGVWSMKKQRSARFQNFSDTSEQQIRIRDMFDNVPQGNKVERGSIVTRVLKPSAVHVSYAEN